jgi:hypothetical protein
MELTKETIIFISTILGSGFSVVGFIYAMIRNLKIDLHKSIDHLEKRMDGFDKRMDGFEMRMNEMDNRMFLLATGKRLEDAILEEKMKKK